MGTIAEYVMGPRARRSLGDAAVSVVCFLAVLAALLVADDRARERIAQTLSDVRATSWGDQAAGLAGVLAGAALDQSIAHAPLLVFTCVAALLLLFMVRT
jgi:hypothetical protein